jgi:adenosyl cobinamide kinase/adenosyl cobinamide phosphate guanylyltransferase
MSINIKILKKPDIPIMSVHCDGKLNTELDKYEMTKHLNKHSTNFICGRPGSGKSSLLWGFFKSKLLKKTFDKILYFAPIQSMDSVKDNIFSSLPAEQKFTELTFENLEDALAQIKSLDDDENACIILDDMTAYLKNNDTLKLFKEMLFNKRHLHLSVFFLVQTFFSIPKELRRCFDNGFIYKTSKDELQNIFNELVELHKDVVLPISKVVYDKPYNYLMINFPTQKMYKKFDEIEINY